MLKPRVFLCYSSSDRKFVQRLAVDLIRAGVEVWYADWEIQPGDSIVQRIEDALIQHDRLVVVLSPEAVKSAWVKRELNASLMRHLRGQDIQIVPIMHKPCEMPTLLADTRYADCTQSYDRGYYELLSSLGIVRPVPAYSTEAYRVSQLDLRDPQGPAKTLFPHTFADWPECIMKPTDENGLDVTVIVGSTKREKTGPAERFALTHVSADILGADWMFSRQHTDGTVRDFVQVADLCSFLTAEFIAYNGFRPLLASPLCRLDVAVSVHAMRRNLILVGASDTNLWFSLATLAHRQRTGYSLPIRYSGDERLYFTCDEIYSDLSGATYSRLEESGFMHCGYLVMAPNPWASEKILILVSGTRATGTQACLLALTHRLDGRARASGVTTEPWHALSSNNRYCSTIPGKVVRASEAEIITTGEFFAMGEKVAIPIRERIPQRHIITDFEFLE